MDGTLGLEGYTGYLVIAYGVTLIVVAGNLLAARRLFRQTRLRLLGQLEKRDGRRPAAVAKMAGPVEGRAGDAAGNEATVGRGS